jgi:TPR repeat protein
MKNLKVMAFVSLFALSIGAMQNSPLKSMAELEQEKQSYEEIAQQKDNPAAAVNAKYQLAKIYLKDAFRSNDDTKANVNYMKAKQLLEEVVQLQDDILFAAANANISLGIMYENGHGTQRNVEKAKKLNGRGGMLLDAYNLQQ